LQSGKDPVVFRRCKHTRVQQCTPVFAYPHNPEYFGKDVHRPVSRGSAVRAGAKAHGASART
jgi:hypothetical protein